MEPATERDAPVFKLSDETDAPKINRRDRIPGLSDFGTFCRDVDRRLAEFQREGVATSLLVLSVDDCQQISDAYGSRAVELAQRTTAQVIKATMRSMDHAARCDANVFALLLPGATAAEASAIAERIRAMVQGSPVVFNQQELHWTISAGVAEFRRNEEREQVLARAKQALAAALHGGNQTKTIGEDELRARRAESGELRAESQKTEH
jgi:diguanylate cyclase